MSASVTCAHMLWARACDNRVCVCVCDVCAACDATSVSRVLLCRQGALQAYEFMQTHAVGGVTGCVSNERNVVRASTNDECVSCDVCAA